MMMMITTIPCVILSLTLSLSVVSAFSSSSSSIASRRARFELSATPFDIDIDDTTVSLLKQTVPDVIVPTTTTTSSVTNPVIDVLQQRPQILLRVTESTRSTSSSSSSSSSLAVRETSSTGLATTTTTTPAASLPFVEKINNIARNTDQALKKRYVIVLSRLLIVCVSFLPLVRTHEMMHKEEYLIQLFLLAISMQPLKKSVTLAQCITNSETGVEECQLEFEELEDAFDIDQPKRTKRKSS